MSAGLRPGKIAKIFRPRTQLEQANFHFEVIISSLPGKHNIILKFEQKNLSSGRMCPGIVRLACIGPAKTDIFLAPGVGLV